MTLVVQWAYEPLIVKPGCDVLTIPGEGETGAVNPGKVLQADDKISAEAWL